MEKLTADFFLIYDDMGVPNLGFLKEHNDKETQLKNFMTELMTHLVTPDSEVNSMGAHNSIEKGVIVIGEESDLRKVVAVKNEFNLDMIERFDKKIPCDDYDLVSLYVKLRVGQQPDVLSSPENVGSSQLPPDGSAQSTEDVKKVTPACSTETVNGAPLEEQGTLEEPELKVDMKTVSTQTVYNEEIGWLSEILGNCCSVGTSTDGLEERPGLFF